MPLTALNEDDRMFQSAVRKFAREQIRPHVREMDEAGVFRKDLIHQFFQMGLMGIEIPEEYGGQGGTFFQAILAGSDDRAPVRSQAERLKVAQRVGHLAGISRGIVANEQRAGIRARRKRQEAAVRRPAMQRPGISAAREKILERLTSWTQASTAGVKS